MIEKRLRSGAVAYYWNPRVLDVRAGFTLGREALGQSFSSACERAAMLNAHLDAFRKGHGAVKTFELQPGHGTIDWLVERYFRSRAFLKVSARAKSDYQESLRTVTEVRTITGGRFGDLGLKQISAGAVDKLYTKHLLYNKDGKRRVRQAALCIVLMRRAWYVVYRLEPSVVPSVNPWAGVTLETDKQEIVPATREEAYALSDALLAHGHPHLALVPLICFEWLQRPENVLAGHLAWSDIRSPTHPRHVRIEHHKTGKKVLQPLEDAIGPLFSELEDRLSATPRIGVSVVVTPGARGEHGLYSDSYARRAVREARRAVKLPEHVTLTGCRHGGMTELGDAELTEQGVMSLSGHATPQAARLYVKRTDKQRVAAARRRRSWVESERTRDKSQNEPSSQKSE
jgi:integrase